MTRGAEVSARAVVHPDDVPAMEERWKLSQASGEPFEIEYRFRRADGSYRWHLGRSVRQTDDSGNVTGWVGSATDIEDRKLAEDRQIFLAEAGWVLGSSLDYEQTLTDVARLAVPRIADWCAVDIFVGKPARAPGTRARRPAQGRPRPRAPGDDAGGVRSRRRCGDPHPHAGARPRDRRRGARDVRLRRAPARDRPLAGAALVRHGPARRPRQGLRHDQPRHRRIRARLRRG